MKFVFGYAVPSNAYDNIFKRRNSLANGNVLFEGRVRKTARSQLDDAKHFLNFFQRQNHENRGEKGGEVGFAVIYVHAPSEVVDTFANALFPSTLVVPVAWEIQGANEQQQAESRNELFKLLLDATNAARSSITALRKELIEGANKTPLLLPRRNFHSKVWEEWMKQLQASIVQVGKNTVAASARLKTAISTFEKYHPFVRVEGKPKRCYLDDHKVEFHSPGKALHGLPRSPNGHDVECWLGAHRRLGAPFHPAFHYDCAKGNKNLKGDFYQCHGIDKEPMEGNTHLNIAPNDFVRT